jgi:dTDP-4-dehydrorhamnose reductase
MKIKGIFHCSALEPFTKYEMSCIIADEFNLNKQNIKPDNTIVENSLRPMNSKLETEYSYSLLNFKPVIKFRESIKDCLQNFVA